MHCLPPSLRTEVVVQFPLPSFLPLHMTPRDSRVRFRRAWPRPQAQAALPLDQIVSSSFGLREKEDVYVLLTISKADIDLDHGRMLKQHITKAIDCRDRPNENQFLLCPTSGPLARAPVITAPATTPRRDWLAGWGRQLTSSPVTAVKESGSERGKQRGGKLIIIGRR